MAITKKFVALDGLDVEGAFTQDGGNDPITCQVANSAPAGAVAGNMWFDNETSKFYVYYDDGSSSQWVEINIT